jgi:AcrR family transcriptional regulator
MATEKLDTNIRQEQIAKATLELAAAGGVNALSVAAVARRIGVVPSALYRHFKGKDQILDSALELINDKLMANAQAVRHETDDPLQQLYRLLMRHVRLIRENRGIPQVIFSQDFYVAHPQRRTRVYQGIRAYLAQIAQIIRSGQQRRQIAPSIAPNAAAVLFLGLIQPSAILWHMSDRRFDVSRQAQRAWPLYRKAIQDGAVRSATPPRTPRKGA